MNKRFFLFTAFLISFAVIFTGCFESKARLDNIETPTYMTVLSYNNKNYDKIKKLESQLKDLKQKGASQDDQNKVSQEQSQLMSKNNLIVNDSNFINRVINEIMKLEGTKQGLTSKVKDELIFFISFPQKIAENTFYTDQVFILSDNTAYIQAYDKNSPNYPMTIKIKISKDIIKYISDYYNSKV